MSKFPNVTVQLTGEDGNAFSVMGAVRSALRDAGATGEQLDEYMNESMSGDYDHLLRTAMEWVVVK